MLKMEGAGNDVSYDERKRFFVEFLETVRTDVNFDRYICMG